MSKAYRISTLNGKFWVSILHQPQEIMDNILDIPTTPQIFGRWNFMILFEIPGINPPLLALAGTVVLVVVEERAAIFLEVTRNYDANARTAVYS